MTKWVYAFGGGSAEGASQLRDLLGGKGANLAEMANIGLPVPPGITLTTEVCAAFYANEKTYPPDLALQIDAGLEAMGEIVGHRFGDHDDPLLVSVRSGARASMPGMMDTVLNLGLTDRTVEALARRSGSDRFAFDSYRRFIQMYSNVVLGVDHHEFEEILESFKSRKDLKLDTDLSGADWRHLIVAYKAKVATLTGAPFPQDPKAQLWAAIGAVFGSWMSERAKTYRRLQNIPASWGTAVTVQAMVFGNMGETSATGVAFTRDPATGENELYGEFLINAQGEDVVAGIRTPQSLTEASRIKAGSHKPSMETALPAVFAEFKTMSDLLERHYLDMQDMEFTVEDGKLWMLQTRSGKRTTRASIRIAVDMAKEGLITRETAVSRVDPAELDQLLHPMIDPKATRAIVACGLPASPGAACGEIVFNSEDAAAAKLAGKAVVLVRIETSPDDIHGMHAAEGVLTTRGGMTSHAAVVARGMGKPCISGAGSIRVDYKAQTMTCGDIVFARGDVITIDGSTGQVLQGKAAMLKAELSGEFAELMTWADRFRRMAVRANAETPQDAKAAREFGADGIGLCRTEHMFFDDDRIVPVREMILAEDEKGRRKALAKLLPIQRADFTALFDIMAGLPVTIRLLDPPLHEFLPQTDAEIAETATALGTSCAKLRARAAELHEVNPMLGFRGCRLAIAFPEIAEMQARAIFEGAIAARRKTGVAVTPEIMVPLVFSKEELDIVKGLIDSVAASVTKETGLTLDYSVGSMMELPRACLRAGQIAETAEFFSFGTNDLTQTGFGISRDDAGSFLSAYKTKEILPCDPFVAIDQNGIGELVELGVERGRRARPGMKIGICGEHGGDPSSIDFFERLGLTYVSCSPFRVPIARLAAAQAFLAHGSMVKAVDVTRPPLAREDRVI